MRAVDIQADGILWLVNRVVFHPRGYALGYDAVAKTFVLLGDGSETFTFGSESVDAPHFQRIKELMP